jgi:NAD(P)-dependent dehydrogenase (short-subunit alcohol dehydrogenase family)
MSDVGGLVALITGAGRGIGRALALCFAEAGAQVIGVARTPADLEQVEADIRARGGTAWMRVCDVSAVAAVAALREEIEARHGRLDVLVNNAGLRMLHVGQTTSYPYRTDVVDLAIDDWDRMLAVNLRGPFLTCKLLASLLFAAGRASVINISSGGGKTGMGGRAPYCASKFGLEGLSQSLAEEWRPHNVAVNTLSPGVSVLTDDLKLDADRGDPRPRRHARPELLVPPCLYLARQDVQAGGLTGARLEAFEWVQQAGLGGWERWDAVSGV